MTLGHQAEIVKIFAIKKKFFSVFFVKNISYDLYMLFQNPSNIFLSFRDQTCLKNSQNMISAEKNFHHQMASKSKFNISRFLVGSSLVRNKRFHLSEKPLSVQCLRHWKAYPELTLTGMQETLNMRWSVILFTFLLHIGPMSSGPHCSVDPWPHQQSGFLTHLLHPSGGLVC